MLKTCEVCNTEYNAMMPTAKYCSPACRQKAYRINQAVTETVTAMSTNAQTTWDLIYSRFPQTARYLHQDIAAKLDPDALEDLLKAMIVFRGECPSDVNTE